MTVSELIAELQKRRPDTKVEIRTSVTNDEGEVIQFINYEVEGIIYDIERDVAYLVDLFGVDEDG